MTQADALRILSTGANVFLTGEPGSGKTHTINSYVSWLRERGIEPAITASTGIAATHIHGMTIHAWSGIGVREFLSDADVEFIAQKEHIARRISKTNVLIIDEISMLSGAVLDMVDRVAREIKRQPERAFGGMQVVLVGDFFQLPPVSRGSAAAFAFESDAWRALNPIICYLTEQHRQEDPELVSILTAIRAGACEPGHISRIISRESDAEGLGEDTPRLYTHNTDVDRVNEEKLAALPGATRSFRMSGSGSDALVDGLKRGCLSPELLLLKEGAVVMCTKNQPAFGYVNGTLGTVVSFESGTGHPVIETRDGRRITVPPAEWAVEEGGKIRARIAQVPLRLAWAVTVHKSQGLSLDEAAMDLSRAFEYGQGYVALSRVRTLAGIHLLGFREEALSVHPRIAAIDTFFRGASEAAEATFMRLEEEGTREELEQAFIKAVGGSLEPGAPKPAKRTTYDETMALIESDTPLAEIAKVRGITMGTVADHVAKLTAAGRLSVKKAIELAPRKLVTNLPKIHAVFEKVGSDKLAPAHARLKGAYTYDELKLARALFIE